MLLQPKDRTPDYLQHSAHDHNGKTPKGNSNTNQKHKYDTGGACGAILGDRLSISGYISLTQRMALNDSLAPTGTSARPTC